MSAPTPQHLVPPVGYVPRDEHDTRPPTPKQPRQDGDGSLEPLKPKKKRSSTASASARTGQACDRCKHRKIRCDNTPGGCLPCRQNHTECKTTDRNTNTARVRGHTEVIEQQNSFLHHHIAELHEQLRELNQTPRNTQNYSVQAWRDEQTQQWTTSATQSPAQYQHHDEYETAHGLQLTSQGTNLFAQAPVPGSSVLPGNFLSLDELSTGIAQPLAIMGHKVDLSVFNVQPPGSARSYGVMLQQVMAPLNHKNDFWQELPQYQECKQLISTYISVCNSWQPLLHGPDIHDLVEAIYHRNYQPRAAEKVIIHIALANILYQMSSRRTDSGREGADREADRHYHCALGLALEVFAGRTLEDVQALAMICLHLRALPDQHSASNFLYWTFRNLIEIKLHRSAKALPEHERPTDRLIIEKRKRVFWTLLTMTVPVCGKLGYPMPLHPTDFDIEPPELLNDQLEPAEGGWGEDKCRIFHAVALMKLSKLYLQMWRLVYAANRSHDYEQQVRELEAQLRIWKEKDWPPILKGPPDTFTNPAHRVMAVWLHWWSTEFEYYLYHPTKIVLGPPQQVPQHALEKSLKLSSDLIKWSVLLWRDSALDTTWANSLSFIGAIFTLLFCLDKRDQVISSAELAKLKNEIDTCMQIISTIGVMLGSGPQLRDHVNHIVETVFEKIKGRQTAKVAMDAVAKARSTINSPSQRSLQEHLQLKSENDHLKHPSTSTRPTHADYVPATANVFHHRTSSASHPPARPQVLSPSSTYYDPYTQSHPQYHLSPTHSQYNNLYSPSNTGGYPAPPTEGSWNHFNGIQQEYIGSMEAGTALMALHHQQAGEGAGGAQQVSPAHQGYIPNLVPVHSRQAVGGPQQWPDSTWGVEEGRGE